MVPTYVFIARKLIQIENLNKFAERHLVDGGLSNVNVKIKECYSEIEECVKSYFPSGSGFDSGTDFLSDISTPERLCFQADFHHMDENGYYDGWTEHTVIVRPSLSFGFNIRVSGRNRNNIKEYIEYCFNTSLQFLVNEYSGEHIKEE